MATITFFFFTTMISGVVIGAGILIFWRWWRKKSFPIAIPLYIQRGNSIVCDLEERGKRIKSKIGYEVIRLMKRKQNIKPPQYEYYMVSDKGKPVYPLYNASSGQFSPVKIMNPPRHEIIEDSGAKNWGILELKRLRDAYRDKEGFFTKYGAFMMNAIFAGMVIFFVIYFGGKIELSSNSLSNAADKLAQAMNVFAGGTNTTAPPASVVAPVTP